MYICIPLPSNQIYASSAPHVRWYNLHTVYTLSSQPWCKCATLDSGQRDIMEKLLESINTTCEGSATPEYEAGKEPAPATPTSKNKGKGIHVCLSCPNLPTLSVSLVGVGGHM